VHPSDLASVLVAYDATVHYRDTGGVQEIGLGEFFQEPTAERRTEHVLPEHAVITRITVPMNADGTRSTYIKAMDRKVWAFALVGVAAVVELDGGVVRNARIVLSGVAPVPWRVPEAERSLAGSQASEATFARAAEIAASEAVALSHNGYKVPLLKALVRRALAEAVA
jgi:xanthine dehydrogenase YagS FAD-binding subunit